MLVEISGLAGSGKTALAHELARLTGGTVVRTESGNEALSWAMRYMVRHPMRSLGPVMRALALMARHPAYGRYVLKVFVVMSANAMKARAYARTRLVFLDEGMEQFTLSEARTNTSARTFARRLARATSGDFSLMLTVAESDRLARLERRTHGVPRHTFEHDATAYITTQARNLGHFLEALTRVRGSRMARVEGKATLQETARAVLAHHERDIRGTVAIVLPEYRTDATTHFAHTYELFSEVARHMHVAWGIERGELPPEGGAMIGHSTFITRFMRTTGWMRAQKRAGVRTLYVHYSFFAAFVGSFIFDRVYLWNCGEAWKYPRGFFFERFVRFVFGRVELVTGTDGLARAYAREYGLKAPHIHVLPNSISLERFHTKDKSSARATLNIPDSARVVTFVHHLSERKGAHHIAPIARALAHEQNMYMCVAGSGPYQKQLTHDVAGIPFVHLLGAVPNARIPELLAASDVLFMPSHEEGFPRVLLEAMAMGLPFVASDVGGVREIVPDEAQAYVLPVGDGHAHARAITQLLNTDTSALSTALRTWVTRYDLSHVTNRFLRIIAGGR